MLCHQARKRLNDYNWLYSNYSQNKQLMEHLGKCPRCYSLVQAEEALRHDLGIVSQAKPDSSLPLETIRERTESIGRQSSGKRSALAFMFGLRFKIAVGVTAVLLAFMTLVPFNFKEKIGYEVAIAGIDKDIALDNHKITSLLGALGMEQDKASTLLDSLEIKQIRLNVGECSETCHLRISDLRTEKDANLIVKAILDLGCCQIDHIIPIFRSESTSLLGHAVKKLQS